MKALLQDWISFISGYLRKEYPKFIFNKSVDDDIPAFVYHHVHHDEFRDCLDHLKRNNYKTLSADECENRLKANDMDHDEVVITFDDGTSDVYEIVFPLLKQYGHKAVVFIIPRWIGTSGMLTWDQVMEMHDSGVIDFQSHSYSHQAICISDHIADFLGPHVDKDKPWNLPIWEGRYQENDELNHRFGMPIYEYASRFSDHYRLIPDEALTQMCIDYVNGHGGEDFFKQPHWKQKLTEQVNQYRAAQPEHDAYESDEERRTQIQDELLRSKNVIEERLQNKQVKHFAFPWNEAGQETLKILPILGFSTAYIGMSKLSSELMELPDLKVIRRVTGDFIRCLPGKGRRSFWGVLLYKMWRRLFKGVMY
ncbi:polysaccharide deacetylase family protein [candidate division KSB1 bacterium]|nr:polysaccharide deacetylase family protein [candidate division KSB1 bacterium]